MKTWNGFKKPSFFTTLLLFFGLFVFHQTLWCQVLGDFRSRKTGDWNQTSTWQYLSASGWIDLPAPDGFPKVVATSVSKVDPEKTTHLVTLPAGITANDLLILLWTDNGAATTLGGADIASWTPLYNDITDNNRRAAFYKKATGLEGSSMTITTNKNDASVHNVYRIAAGTWKGVPEVSTLSTANTANPDPPSLNPLGWVEEPTMWLIAGHIAGDGDIVVNVPDNYAATLLEIGTGGGGGGKDAYMASAYRFFTASAEDPGAFSNSHSRSSTAATIAIRGELVHTYPNSILGPGSATVLNGHIVTTTENVSVPNVTINPGGTVALNDGITFTIPASGSFTVSGTLQTGTDGTATLSGAGNFILQSDASLWVSSPLGITASANAGNILVAGTRSFHPAANLHFNGTADQETGDAMATVNNLEVSGGSTKTLSANLRVNGILTFNQAKIQSTLDKLLTLSKAGAINGYGENAFVFGSLKIIGTGDAFPYEVLFPLRGKNHIQPVTIKYPTQSNLDAVTVTHVSNGHGGGKHPDVDEVAAAEYWDITPSWSAGSLNAAQGVTVELSYRSPNNGKYFSTRISASYGLGHYNGTQWEIAGPMKTLVHTTPDDGINGTVSMGEIKSFSPFAPIAIAESMLPVDLGDFSVKVHTQGKVELTWSTYTESLNRGFRIERMVERSNKGFEQVGYVFSKSLNGNSMTTLEYTFIDHAPVAGKTSFYRIVQEDLDGKLTNSEVKRVRIGNDPKLNLFPNPSAGAVFLSNIDLAGGPLLQVVAPTGTVLYKTQPMTQANQLLRFAQPGVYHLSIFYPKTGERIIKTIIIK